MEQLQNLPVPGEFYHCKEKLYQILTIAVHTETEEQLVIYQALYGNFRVFAKPLSIFGDVTADGLPQFTKVDMGGQNSIMEIADNDHSALASGIEKPPVKQKELLGLMETFYDTDSYEEKLDILMSMQDDLNHVMLANIAVSLDIAVPDGSLEEQFQSIVSCLKTMKRYQTSRLR